ncbi:hypothetical protein TWF730_004123 [Orbilia blumenaviensis]|uniref:Uncharacterized protein n=1 Tax=Orbilia blumenaviensis TaxID=1796055 RepID=A0AAV9U3C0_9PEZI
MTDTDNEKAEKLAAARKRFEELKRKKQPGKKASSSISHREPTSSDSNILETPSHDVSSTVEYGGGEGDEPESTNVALSKVGEDDEHTIKNEDFESQLGGVCSENERTESNNATNEVLLESLPEIYRKQASVIDELRADKQKLLDEIQTLQTRAQEGIKAIVDRDKALEDLASVSEELQTLREKNGVEQATLLEGAGEVSALKTDVASLNRQIVHLQSQLAQKDKAIVEMRRDSNISSPGPDEATKQEERIEGMSVELSELRAALEAAETSRNSVELERKSLESLLNSMRGELKVATEKNDSLEHKLSSLTESINSGQAKSSAWEEKNRAQEDTIVKLDRELAEIKQTVDELEKSKLKLQASEKNADARYRDIERKLNIAQRENSGMQLRLAELKSNLHQSFAKTEPSTIGTPEISHWNGATDSEPGLVGQSQDNIKSNKLSSDHLWKQVLADENSHDFLDVDLRAVGRNNTAQNQSVLGHPQPASQNDKERKSLTERVRRELEGWRGHRINLVDVYSVYDDSYSKVFDI